MTRKYRNRKLTVDGVTFDSHGEFMRWSELQILEKAGQIANLERQVRIPLIVNGTKVCAVVIDFRYFQDNKTVAEDHKSRFTSKLPVWRLKKKLLQAIYPNVEIREHVK